MKARGGKAIFGASIGILMLDTRFPRIPGDMCNAATWPFPVLYRVVRGATPERVVRRQAEGLLEQFIAAGQDLVRDGVDGLATNCGFLSLFQDELKARCAVPVAASSLMQVAAVNALLAEGKVAGILTISRETLSKRHLKCAGVPANTPIEGTENGREFSRVILGDELDLDTEQARRDVLEAGERLVANNPDVGAIVLECTNMVPYARDLASRFAMPVYSIYSLLTWFQAGLSPRGDF